jgi:hypothetical protein
MVRARGGHTAVSQKRHYSNRRNPGKQRLIDRSIACYEEISNLAELLTPLADTAQVEG